MKVVLIHSCEKGLRGFGFVFFFSVCIKMVYSVFKITFYYETLL